MQPFHHDLMAQLDAAQASGELTYLAHREMRAALRSAQMSGRAVNSMAELKGMVRLAYRDQRGRFHN